LAIKRGIPGNTVLGGGARQLNINDILAVPHVLLLSQLYYHLSNMYCHIVNMNIIIQKFVVAFFCVCVCVSYAHQGSIYLTKNTVKTVL